jgi:hypothetical protein
MLPYHAPTYEELQEKKELVMSVALDTTMTKPLTRTKPQHSRFVNAKLN